MTTETWEQETEQAWGALETRLTQWLADVPPKAKVIIELPWPDDAIDGAAPYVRLAVEDGAVLAEAAGNRSLDAQFRLGKPRRKALRALGWKPPGDGLPDYWCIIGVPDGAGRVARMVVEGMRNVFGIPAPSFLVVSGVGENGALTGDALPFGLTEAARTPVTVDLTAVQADGPDELRDLVAAALAPVVDEVEFDPDGDIPVPAGNTVLYVGVEEDAPLIRLFAPLLHGVRWTPRVGHTLNEVNQRLTFAKVIHQGDRVLAVMALSALPFVPEQLRQAVVGFRDMADGYDETLKSMIGGLLFCEPANGEA